MADAPAFDPSKPFESVSAPAFDPSKPFEAADAPDSVGTSLSRAVTDIPHEIYSAGASALHEMNAINPWGQERTEARARGEAPSMTAIPRAIAGAGSLVSAPVTGPIRAVGGHLLDLLNRGMRSGAVSLYGEDKVRQAEAAAGLPVGGGGYEAAKSDVDALMMGLGPGRLHAPVPPPVPPPLSDVAAASQRLGVAVPRVADTDNLIAQRTAGALKEIPLIGDPLVRASREASEGLGQAAEQTAAQYGHGNVLTGGENAKDALVDWITGGSKKVLDRLYGRVDPLVNQTATRPLHETLSTVNDLQKRRTASGATDQGKAIGLVSDAVTRPGGLTYQGVKDLRTRIGSYLDGSILPEPGTSIPELKQIYGALTTDLRATVLDHGGPDALKAFDRANDIAKQVASRREALAKIVGTDAGAAPERVIDRLAQMASTKASSDINKLTMARKAMGPDAWNEMASGIISRIGRDAEGNFSPDRFLTAYGRLSDEGKKALFGSTGRQDLVQALDDIATISSRAKQLASYGNPSGTGRTVTTVGALGALFAEPISTLTTAIGGNLVARAMARPATARPLANWMSANLKAQLSNDPAAKIALGYSTANLARRLSNLGISPVEVIRRLQGPIPAAADQGPNQDQRQRGGRLDAKPDQGEAEKAQERAHGGAVEHSRLEVKFKDGSPIGLAQNPPGVHFQCRACKYIKAGRCQNPNPQLKDRKVKPTWCCNLFDHSGMKVIV